MVNNLEDEYGDENEHKSYNIDKLDIGIWLNIIIIVWLTIMGLGLYQWNKSLLSAIQSNTCPLITTSTTTTIPLPVYQNCKVRSGTFYYLSTCPHCQQELAEGGIDALAKDGVSINKVEVTTGNYSFIEYVPTWFVNGNMTVGYQTIEQIRGLFQCQ